MLPKLEVGLGNQDGCCLHVFCGALAELSWMLWFWVVPPYSEYTRVVQGYGIQAYVIQGYVIQGSFIQVSLQACFMSVF